jgi:hypothetical protein
MCAKRNLTPARGHPLDDLAGSARKLRLALERDKRLLIGTSGWRSDPL